MATKRNTTINWQKRAKELEKMANALAKENGLQASRIGALEHTIENLKRDLSNLEEELVLAGVADASGLFGSGGPQKEPETEVGYLRRELAYAQGQLHQSHLTVKQLCGRRSMPDTPVPSWTDKLHEELLGRINDVLLHWENLRADRVNSRDLSAAGIKNYEMPL